jgi:hypothetical protein
MNAQTVGTVLLSAAFIVQSPPPSTRDDRDAEALAKFLAQPAELHQYRASRHLEGSGAGQRGWLEVQTEYTPGVGLKYVVTAEGGSGRVRKSVLRSMLDEERRLLVTGDGTAAALSPANYQFTPAGVDAGGLAIVTLTPLRKETFLISGRMFLSPPDGGLVRVEGRLAKSPSFWLTRVTMTRTYQRLNGAVMPVMLESAGRLRLLGGSTLRMVYSYQEIDGQPVETDLVANR